MDSSSSFDRKGKVQVKITVSGSEVENSPNDGIGGYNPIEIRQLVFSEFTRKTFSLVKYSGRYNCRESLRVRRNPKSRHTESYRVFGEIAHQDRSRRQ